MKNIRLSLFNLRKNRREAAAIIFLTMITSMMLSIYAANSSKIEKVFSESFEASGSVDNMILFDRESYHNEYRRILEQEYETKRLTENEIIFSIASDVIDKDGSDISYNLIFATERTERRIESFIKNESLPEEEIKALEHPLWLPVYFSIVKGYVPGDIFTVVKSGKQYPFTVAGFYETGLMSSDGYGFKLIVSEEDYDLFSLLYKSPTAKPFSALAFDAGEDFSFEEYMTRCENASQEDVRSGVQYFSEKLERSGETTFIELFLLLIIFLSLVTLISSGFMIRNKISSDIEDQMGQIGVLEALGYRSKEISFSYFFEYVITGGIGSVLGGALAVALTPAVNYGIEKMMGRRTYGSTQTLKILAASLLVIFLVTLSALIRAASVKKYPPVIALRRGIGTHHFEKNLLPLERGTANINLRLGLKGLAGDLKAAAGTAVCIMTAGTAILLAVVSFSFFKDGTAGLESMMGNDVDIEMVKLIPGVDPEEFRREVLQLPEVRKALVSYEMKYISEKGSDSSGAVIVYDDFADAENFYPSQGRFPAHENEVMLGLRRAKNENLSVGDSIVLMCGGLEKNYIITGLASSMMNGGTSFYLTSEGYRRINVNARPDLVNLYLTEGTDRDAFEQKLSSLYGGTAKDAAKEEGSDASLEDRIRNTAREKIAVLLTQYGVTNVDYAVRIGDELITGNSRMLIIDEIKSWRGMVKSQLAPVADTMKKFTILALLLITLIVAVILWIIASSNVRRQRKNFGIMKSLGYTSKDLMQQTALRFMPITAVSLLIASAAAVYLNKAFWLILFATVAKTDLPLIVITDLFLFVFCYFVTYAGAGRAKKISVTELMTE